VRPKGNDDAFVSKVQTMNKDSDCLIVEKSFQDYEFGVKHYAGCVVYDATNFVTKNTDSLPVDLVECARQCTNEIISKHLDNDSIMNVDSPSSAGKKKAPPGKNPRAPPKRSTSSLVQSTVWSKFRNQLTVLMTNLGQTRTRYIRCIKPNTEKKPAVMQHLSTVEQLRCAGVVAAVTISRSAFPNRLEHEIVLERFKSLWTKGNHRASPEHGDPDLAGEELKLDVEHLLTSALRSLEVEKDGGMQKAFVIGKTRAYFRAGALEHLEAERLKGLGVWAVEMQRIVRGFVKRSQYVRLQAAEVKAAAKMREFVARRKYLRQRSAVIVLQCWNRCILAVQELVQLRKNHKATIIQTHFRMMVARASFQKYRRAAIVIQAMSRGAIQRPKYRIELAEKIEEAKLENQLKALQRKLEEAEARRVEAEKKAEQNAAPVVVYREQPSEEKKNEAPVEGEGEMKPPAEVTTTVPAEIDSIASPDNAQLTSQQQTLMDESGKMLEYLRKEVFKLRSQNAQLRTDFDLLKENNQRLMDANASAGASFAALNQHAKQLNKTNAKLVSDIQNYRQQLQRMNIQQVEVKEELKMKQATYIAEVHSRLQYQKTMAEIVDMVQDRCRDSRLVEDVLALADDCEAEYMSGPTGLDNSGPISSLFSSPVKGNNESIVGKFKSFFS
jgi:myosin-5